MIERDLYCFNCRQYESEVHWNIEESKFYVSCKNCYSEGIRFDNKEEAIKSFEGGDIFKIWAIDSDYENKLKEIENLKEELKHYKQWVDDLQSGGYVNCVYCGHRYGPRESTPGSMSDILTKHVEICEKHPLYKARKQNEELEKELKFYKEYAGSQMVHSDFQTADQMRQALTISRHDKDVLEQELYNAISIIYDNYEYVEISDTYYTKEELKDMMEKLSK